MPPMEVVVNVKNYYQIGTKIEKEFKKDPCYVYDVIFVTFDLETKWEEINKHTEKEDNYTGGQISI